MKNFLLSVLLLCHSLLQAQPGSIDVSFGNSGTVVTQFGIGYDQSGGLIIQPDQKIVLSGHAYIDSKYKTALIRLNPDGSYDNSFSADGIAFPDFDYGTTAVVGFNPLVMQPDGKLVCAAHTGTFGTYDLSVIRFNSDGSVDTNFGTNGQAIQSVYFGDDYEESAVLQPDGKILVVGNALTATTSMVAARFNSDGSIDNTFNGNGTFLLDYGGSEVILDARILPDGKILLLCKYFLSNVGTKPLLIRLNSDGSFDNSFDGDGILPLSITTGDDVATSIALLPDGKILLAGDVAEYSSHDVFVMRLDSNGTLDNSFGTGGITIKTNGGNEFGASVAITQDGKILVAGYVDLSATIEGIVLLFSSSGILDASFGDNGEARVEANDYRVVNMKLQDDQKIVISGWYSAGGIDFEYAATRLNYLDNVGIHEAQPKSSFSIFPNPCDGRFSLQSADNSKDITGIKILDTSGRIVYASELESVITELKTDLPSGIYFLALKTDQGQQIQKLVVQR